MSSLHLQYFKCRRILGAVGKMQNARGQGAESACPKPVQKKDSRVVDGPYI